MQINKLKKIRKGFTLVELIIYIALIGAAVSSFLFFSVSISNARNKAYAAQEVQANARMALDIISQKIRLADGIVNPIEGAVSNSLELDMPDPMPNITFDLSNNKLNIVEGSGFPTQVTSNKIKVSNLAFSNLVQTGKRKNIRLELALEFSNPSGDVSFQYSQNFQSTISLRK